MIPAHRPCLGRDELAAVEAVLASRWLGLGGVTESFEERVAAILGARHVIGVSSGTAALHLALAVLDLRPRDEVVVPSLTFVATIQAILAAGARPVFCEVDPATLLIDVADALARVSGRTRCILPVHFGGEVCAVEQLRPAARHRGLWIVEDAAHAFGSRRGERFVGTLGDLTCFSFDPIKNITCGEGGAVATEDDRLAERMRRARVLGMDRALWARRGERRSWYYSVAGRGFRYHLPNLNAAIGLAQLGRMEEFRTRKRAIAARYDEALRDVAGIRLLPRSAESFPFSYVIRVLGGLRDGLIEHLAAQRIGTTVNYIPNHLQPAFAEFHAPLPATERVYEEIVGLPLYCEIRDVEVDRVIAEVCRFVRENARRRTRRHSPRKLAA